MRGNRLVRTECIFMASDLTVCFTGSTKATLYELPHSEIQGEYFSVSVFQQFETGLIHKMRFSFIISFSFLFAAYSANGAQITNATAVVPAKREGETVVCNQYIGQDRVRTLKLTKLSRN